MSLPPNDQPHWPHDCKDCKFLGGIYINQRYDVYVCPQGRLGGTFRVRFGPEPESYGSWDRKAMEQRVMSSFAVSIWPSNEVIHELQPIDQALLVVLLRYAANEA